jgi:chemotaxis family two-component system sensor kinase Cph1
VNVPVTLENCDQEPIHIIGTVQSHGVLLAFNNEANLVFSSVNGGDLLAIDPQPDVPVEQLGLPTNIINIIREWLSDAAKNFASFDLSINGRTFDLIGNRNDDDLLIVEFEITSDSAPADTSFATLVHRAMERFKRQTDIDMLLGMVAAEVRTITGFDRVMAYRFRHDDSGEVVRESRREGLENWEGHRYPSSDIPAQARRLYILNTLRLIADVEASPVPVISFDRSFDKPLDMSFCVLRSVSPIHIEYLMNMGVKASLSVSIVIDGKLWGMIACHHSKPRHVSHGVRMLCEVIGQMVAITIGGLRAAVTATKLSRATQDLAEIGIRARAADDLLTGISVGEPNLAALIDADVCLSLWGGRVAFSKGALPADVVTQLAKALGAVDSETITSERLDEHFPDFAEAVKPFCGINAVCFDVGRRGWVVWLRAEQIEKVRWAGKPEKILKVGPNGPRLTPRGSFLEWREEVRGSSLPWEVSDVKTADALRSELNRIAGAHAIEIERARHQLLASLGHDLREPLHSISLAAQILQKRDDVGAKLGARIETSSGRMSRLVTQILDMSLLQSTIGMVLDRENIDLSELLRGAVNDANFSYPGSNFTLNAPDTLLINADGDRLTQVVSNLVSNARHHGLPGEPVTLFAQANENEVIFGVENRGSPIPDDVRADLFKAFKPALRVNQRNRTGLGLGLYIAHEIVQAHGGTLALHCDAGLITFTATIPRQWDADGSESYFDGMSPKVPQP